MTNWLTKILGLASYVVPGASPSSWWRPALIAFFTVMWTVTQVVFPYAGLEQVALDPWFYKAWLALAGIYSILRTREKAQGQTPERRSLEEKLNALESRLEDVQLTEAQIKDAVTRVNVDVRRTKPKRKGPKLSELPVYQADPDGSGPKVPYRAVRPL